MKNRFIHNISTFALCLTAGLAMVACSDWTDVEGVNIVQQNPSEIHPELQAKYLANLRSYKQADHKVVYAWFDNSEKVPFSRGQHLTAVPDSIDAIALMYPDNLADFELKEMESIRSEKGTKVIYTVGYETIRRAYDDMVKEETAKDEAYVAPDFLPILKEAAKKALALSDTYNYDGIILGYQGKNTLHMTAEEKALYTSWQEAFLSEIATWQGTHKEKMIVFEGNPQNLLNKEILKSCKHIILNTADITSASMLSVQALLATEADVPTEKFVVAARTTSLDSTDKKTGFYDGTLIAITEAAYWVTAPESGFSKAGLAIYNVQNGYYNPSNVYQYVKEAINIMNPAPKN